MAEDERPRSPRRRSPRLGRFMEEHEKYHALTKERQPWWIVPHGDSINLVYMASDVGPAIRKKFVDELVEIADFLNEDARKSGILTSILTSKFGNIRGWVPPKSKKAQ